MKRYFITGTDTDVGKTLISTALLHKAQQQGFSTFGLKPVAAGCELTSNNEWQNEDAQLLRQYSSERRPYNLHNPVALKAAIAPHIAAEQENMLLSKQALLQACEPGLQLKVDIQLIEGAGGWLVPLNANETLADFACALNAEVILVVGLRLGCINHALLTANSIQQSGAKLVGWVANNLSNNMQAQASNLAFLQQWFARQQIPLLGQTPYIHGINRYQAQQLQNISHCLALPE